MSGRFLKGEGKAFPSLQPCPSVILERSDRVQGKSSATSSAGTPRNAPYNNARSAVAARTKKRTVGRDFTVFALPSGFFS